MQVSKLVIASVVLAMSCSTLALARARQPTLRDIQEQACSNDAMTLCKDDIPDEEKVTACMTAKRAQLSPGCAKMFVTAPRTKKK
jgi:hypothetical protein